MKRNYERLLLREIVKDGAAERGQAHRDQYVGMQGCVSSDEVDPRLELEQLSRVRDEQRVHLLRVQCDLASVVPAAGHLHGTGKSRLSARRESRTFFFSYSGTFQLSFQELKCFFTNQSFHNNFKIQNLSSNSDFYIFEFSALNFHAFFFFLNHREKKISSRRSENRGRVDGGTRAEKSRGVEERGLQVRRGDQYACTGNAFGRWRSCPHASGTLREKRSIYLSIADKFDIVLIYTPTRHTCL